MGVTTTNLIQGPAVIYLGAFGVTEPATIATAPGAGWTDCGGTVDGVMLSVANEWSQLKVDQIVDPVGSRKVSRAVTIKTQLAEATLLHMQNVMALPAPVSNKISADNNLEGFMPTYSAILLDGIAPGGFRRRVILRRTIPSEAVETGYKKDGQTVLPVTWLNHFVTSAIAPFVIEDAVA